MMGPCAGGAVYSPALTDFIMMVEDTSYMFVTGPNVVKTVTHEEVTSEELGGASTHATKSGVTHFTYPNEAALINGLKRLLSYLPQNCDEEPPVLAYEPGDEMRMGLKDIVPDNPNHYDIKEVIAEIADADSFHEVHSDFAENMWSALFDLQERVLVWLPINRPTSPEYWTSMPQLEVRDSSDSVMPSIFLC